MKHTELLAPAGDYTSLTAAFHAGADAVYLAGKQFGARAYANNFEEEELLQALDYAHLHGRKIYLTLNTLIKESEFSSVASYLTPYYNNGLDGIIIQDLGLIPFLKEEFPGLELHASTQMTVNNYRSAKWLKEQGLCCVVPSRELSLTELEEIKTKAGIEVEAFIHGAMCYGYSGQCLFSSFLGGRSGNRGRCAQPCRLPYTVNTLQTSTGTKEIYPLSLKDLCSLPYIYELLDVGIDSFKIEGRMKSPEYVAGVTSIYRKYIDLYYQGKRPAIAEKDLRQLSGLYIRSEMKDGYLKKHNGKDMVSVYSPSYQGNDDSLIALLHEQYCKEAGQLPVYGYLTLSLDNPAMLIVSYNDCTVTVCGDTVMQAQKRPLTQEDVAKQMHKTGNSMFYFEHLEISMDSSVFLPLGRLNELRREALEALKEALLQPVRRHKKQPEQSSASVSFGKEVFNENPVLRCHVTTKEQLFGLMQTDTAMDRIYVPTDLFYLHEADMHTVLSAFHNKNTDVYLSLPRIIRRRDEKYLDDIREMIPCFDGILVKNLESLCYLEEIEYKGAVVTDSSLYNWNRHAMSFLNAFREEYTYPLELTLQENKALQDVHGEYIIYGRTPMMVSANCIRKTTDNCTHSVNGFEQSLTDRYRKELPVFANCVHCYNEIFNAVSMSCHKELPQLLKNRFYKFRLHFTNEDADTAKQILAYFGHALYDTSFNETFPLKDYTLGHFKEGAI